MNRIWGSDEKTDTTIQVVYRGEITGYICSVHYQNGDADGDEQGWMPHNGQEWIILTDPADDITANNGNIGPSPEISRVTNS